MPLPSTTGGSGLSRSEAAIEAWKHRQRAAPKPGGLDPKIAARVKEILAGKQKKGKAKAKPKGGKAKPAGTKQEIANKNRAAVAKQGGMDKLEGTLVRVAAGMATGGKDLEPEAHDELIKKGLAKRRADGSVTLSPAGRKWKSAADKGDAEGAGAALAEGRGTASEGAAKEKEKSAKVAEREKVKQAKVAERATKQKQAQQAAKQKAQAAAKVKAEKAKAKAAKPVKEAAAPAAKQASNRAKVAKDMADSDQGLSPSGSAALSDFADGKPLKEETAAEFEKMGLTEKGSDGTPRLTADGKAAAQAMSKGDTRAAIDAISRAADKKKAKTEARKALVIGRYFALKAQTDQERAMFAKMGGGKGPGKGYDKGKSTLEGDKAKGGGGSSGDAIAKADQSMRKQGLITDKQITTEEKQSLQWYQGVGHDRVNAELRGHAKVRDQHTLDTTTGNLDQIMDRSKLKHDVTVHRGMYTETPEAEAQLASWKPGKTIKDKGYVSTTINPDAAKRFGADQVEVRIRAPAGTPAIYMPTAHPLRGTSHGSHNEHEVLLGRNLNYRVVSKNRVGDKTTVELEVVP